MMQNTRNLADESLELADEAMDELDRARAKRKYWHTAWKESKAREEETAAENRVLKSNLKRVTGLSNRYKKRIEFYRDKLAEFEDAEIDLIDEECEKNEDGRYRAENGWDQRDYYREM